MADYRNSGTRRRRGQIAVLALAVLGMVSGVFFAGPSAEAQQEDEPDYSVAFYAFSTACDTDNGFEMIDSGWDNNDGTRDVFLCQRADHVAVDNEAQCLFGGLWDEARGVCLLREHRSVPACLAPAVPVDGSCWFVLRTSENIHPDDGGDNGEGDGDNEDDGEDEDTDDEDTDEDDGEDTDDEDTDDEDANDDEVVEEDDGEDQDTDEDDGEEDQDTDDEDTDEDDGNDDEVDEEDTDEDDGNDDEVVEEDIATDDDEVEASKSERIPFRSLKPACADSEMVQTNAQNSRVGDVFKHGGSEYLIITGDTCGFNCHDGWDVNCNGRLGDFCRSDYDLGRVADIGRCMEDYELTPQ